MIGFGLFGLASLGSIVKDHRGIPLPGTIHLDGYDKEEEDSQQCDRDAEDDSVTSRLRKSVLLRLTLKKEEQLSLNGILASSIEMSPTKKYPAPLPFKKGDDVWLEHQLTCFRQGQAGATRSHQQQHPSIHTGTNPWLWLTAEICQYGLVFQSCTASSQATFLWLQLQARASPSSDCLSRCAGDGLVRP